MAARDIIQAAAGAAGATEANYIEDVFSTYLYTGTGASQTINNGIDLATKGGLVWSKSRSAATQNIIYDTTRGLNKALFTALTNAENTNGSDALTAFNSTGYSIGADANLGHLNTSGSTYASWTFRKQPKFFDIVTYTGTGSARTIAHNLGATPGMIIVKRTNTTGDWVVYHKSIPANYINLNYTNAASVSASAFYWGNDSTNIQPTSTVFSIGSASALNASGGTYVAYLFADSNSGGFGPAGTDSVVACGSYTGTGNASGPIINLGWEPQFILIKNIDNSASNWQIIDNMRGMPLSSTSRIYPNNSDAEVLTGGVSLISPLSNGFQPTYGNSWTNGTGQTHIYLAIRRGPMKTPTDATKVFKPVTQTTTGAAGQNVTCGFPPDFTIMKMRSVSSYGFGAIDKLRGTTALLQTSLSASELTNETGLSSFGQSGLVLSGSDYNLPIGQSAADMVFNLFRRAPGFFDVVCYTGTGGVQTVSHNLGVAPELIITKCRVSGPAFPKWWTYSASTGNSSQLVLNENTASVGSSQLWNNTSPTATNFSLGSYDGINGSGYTYVAYLFATCAGVSKVFSYTGNGSSQTINCGFTAGARFVLIKRRDSTGDWYVWDTARGIVSANDPHLSLNTTAAEVTTDDTIDPDSSGFIVNQVAATNVNVSSATYIGLAIA